MQKTRLVIGITLLFVLLVPITTVFAQGSLPPVPPVPVNGNYVVDQLNWLDSTQVAEINSIVAGLDREGLAEIVVFTTDNCGDDYKAYRYQVFNTWGVGHADDDDGLLIAVCWGEEGKRNIEQETGYGMGGTLPDTLVNKVVKEVYLPYQNADRKGDGLVAMVRTYNEIIRGVDYKLAIEHAVQPLKDDGQYIAPTTEPVKTGPYDAEWMNQVFLGFYCGTWLIILIIIFFVIAVANGWINPGNSYGSSDSNDSHYDPPSTGGGDSGGGGASTNIG